MTSRRRERGVAEAIVVERCSIVLPAVGERRAIDVGSRVEVAHSECDRCEVGRRRDVQAIVQCAFEQRESVDHGEPRVEEGVGSRREQRPGSDPRDDRRSECVAHPPADRVGARLHVNVQQHEVRNGRIERPPAEVGAGSRVRDRLTHAVEATA